MKILITGGAGYAGSNISMDLLNLGHEVTILDNLLKGDEGLKKIKSKYHNSHFINENIEHFKSNEKFDAIIHLAALVGDLDCDSNKGLAASINVIGTKRALDLRGSDTKFILFSTSAIYGPVEESTKENAKKNPLTYYGETKAEADELVEKSGGTVLRLNHLYGPSHTNRLPEIVNEFIIAALINKKINLYHPRAWRAICSISDASRAVQIILNTPNEINGKVWNVVGENLQKIQICEEISEILPATMIHLINAPNVNPRNNIIDGSKFYSDFDIIPNKSIKETLIQIQKELIS